MITAGEAELALRQQQLRLRSQALRSRMAEHAVALEAPFAAADRVRSGARWLYGQRVWVGVTALAVLVVRPRRAWRLATLGWWLWRSARRAQPWLAAAGLIGPPAEGTRRAR